MQITIRQLIYEGCAVQLRCVMCGKIYAYHGKRVADIGLPHLKIRDVQRRLRCRCGGLGEVIITFPSTILDDRRIPSAIPPHAKFGPRLWDWD